MENNFGCCSRYQECSDKNRCVNIELMDYCDYWNLNLSKGRNFYSKKEQSIQQPEVQEIKKTTNRKGEYEQVSLF